MINLKVGPVFANGTRAKNHAQRHRALALRTASVLGLAITGGLFSPHPAQAQESSSETIIVTGSHIATPGFEAPTPVTSVSAATIQAVGALNVNQLQFQIPQLVPNIQYQGNGGSVGQITVDLRGLGSTRTLLLMNGMRVMPTSFDGTTDNNIIPTSLVRRVDVVTGGASAAYGSDAIAGVVNFILDDQYEGLKGNVYAGQSQKHDVREVDVGLTGGFGFDQGRGHFVISGEIYSNGGAQTGVQRRPLLNMGWAGLSNPNYVIATGANPPRIIVSTGVNFSNMTAGGVIVSGPLKGIYFGTGGIPQTFQYGTAVSGNFMFGGTNANFTSLFPLYPILGHQTLFSRVTYDISSDVTAWAQLMAIHTTGKTITNPNYDAGTSSPTPITIGITNPFLPASVVTQMNAAKITNFVMGREGLELGAVLPSNHVYDMMYSAGLKGKAFGDYTWDLGVEFSKVSWITHQENLRYNANWVKSINVVPNPSVGGVAGVPVGSPVCASTITTPGDGCIPNNIIGPNLMSQEGINYVRGTSTNGNPQQAWDISGNFQGAPLSNWAGEVSFAIGGEIRRDTVHGYDDPISLANGWRTGNVQPVIGHFQVMEAYLETEVPLLADQPLVKSLSTNIAGRITDYSNFGTVETWKFGMNYSVNDELRFRGTMSSDIRAPTLSELYSAIGVNTNQVRNDITNKTNVVVNGTGGNPNLLPEQANTYTVGVVYSPAWLDGFQTSLDWYDIRLHQSIVTSSLQAGVDNCQIYHIAAACALIQYAPNGDLAVVNSIPYNVGNVDQEGVDFEVLYSFSAPELWSMLPDGQVQMSARANYVDYLQTIGASGAILNSVNTGSNAKWRGVVNVNYSWSKFSVNVNWRYAGATRYSNLYVVGQDINVNDIGSRYYFNLSGDWEVAPGLKLYAKSDNILNTSPPISASLSGVIEPSAATSRLYDNIGRTYGLGLRFTY